MSGEPFDVFEPFNRAFDAFERKILARRISDLDREIATTKCEVARFGNEIDIEIVRLLENTRANWLKVLKHLDERLKDTEGQMSFSEMMIEASGKPRSLAPPDPIPMPKRIQDV